MVDLFGFIDLMIDTAVGERGIMRSFFVFVDLIIAMFLVKSMSLKVSFAISLRLKPVWIAKIISFANSGFSLMAVSIRWFI